jgi:hypothetical protein
MKRCNRRLEPERRQDHPDGDRAQRPIGMSRQRHRNAGQINPTGHAVKQTEPKQQQRRRDSTLQEVLQRRLR